MRPVSSYHRAFGSRCRGGFVAAPKTWSEASQRARAKWERAKDRLVEAMKQPVEDKRADAYKQTLVDVRSIAEPYLALLEAANRRSDKRAFHEWIADKVPNWGAIKTLRELDYHDGHLPSGHGAFMNTPTTLTAEPGESLMMQAVPGKRHMQVTRRKRDGSVDLTDGPPIQGFETLGPGGWFSKHGLGPAEWSVPGEPCLEVPGDLVTALQAWKPVIDGLSKGWTRP